RGDQVASAQTVVSTPDGDKFVFATREDQTGARGRGRNGAADAGKVTWFMADLPKVDLSSVPVLEGEPPATVRVTEVYSFSPKVTNGDKAKFSLKKRPDGAVVDPTCGRFTWRPTDKQIGKNDVEISATVGGDEFTVLSFEVLVTSADEFAAVECDFGDLTATQVVASEDGASLFLLEAKVQGQPAPASRVIVWDIQKKQIEKSINVPKSPEHMALVQGKLVVTCPDSQVVALIDAKEKKVTKSVPIQLDSKSLTPRNIFKDSAPGKVLVSCGPEQGGFDAQTVEIGLADGKVSPLYFGFGRGAAYVAVAKDWAVWSDSSWGSVSKLSDLRHAPKKGDNNRGVPQIDPDERSYQIVGARAVNNGANFVAADAGKNKTGLLSADWKKVLWTADGILAGVHPTKPIVIVYVNDPNQHFESDTLTFRGINSQSGRQVWQLIVKMPHRIRVDAWTFLRSGGVEVRSSKDGGEDLYLTAANDAFDRTGGHWYRVPMPRKDAGSTVTVTNEPPTEVDAGSTFNWAPTITGGSPTFTLKAAPDGMTVDAKTGRLTWKPDEASIGKHDVLLIAKVGSDEIPIAFELRVRPGHGGGDSSPSPKSDDSKSKSEKSDKTKTDKSDKSDKPEKSDKPKPTDDGDNEH
ncbi:MAG TPA: putative Ig domain-containing protein, partial [Planctomycetota bacterium]|nr:putative Ig domain-containing protein [Planctomycetota bacterium]